MALSGPPYVALSEQKAPHREARKAPPGKRHVAQSAMRVESATHKNHTLIPNWSGMNTKKFNSSVVPSLLAAAGGTVLEDSRRTSLSRDGKMMVGAGAVALQRAGTPAERQHVVCLVKKHWDRVGQRPREHLLVWDTADGSPPADALLEDTEQAYEELPWFHKAAIGNGAPCSYYSVVRDVGDLELE